jgi:hypothetical protein
MKATSEDIEFLQKLSTSPLDPIVTSQLFEKYYTLLISYLSKQFEKIDKEEFNEIAFSTLDNLIKHPKRYNPEKGTLEQFLKMDATGDLLNKIKKTSVKKKLTVFVEDINVFRNKIKDDGSDNNEEEIIRILTSKLETLFPNPRDFEIAKSMECGVRETEKYVALLDLTNFSIEVQRSEVKRNKDRINKILDRSDWASFKKKIKIDLHD